MIFFLLDMVARRFQDKDLIPIFMMPTNFVLEEEKEGQDDHLALACDDC